MNFLDYSQAQKVLGGNKIFSAFVYKEEIFHKNCQKFLDFPSAYGHKVRYAIKANPHHRILKLFDQLGLYFDASSEFEFQRALLAGIKPEKIQISSQQLPYRYREDILRYQGVFNACSLRQLKFYGENCPHSHVSLRINPGIGSGSHQKTNVGGRDSSFGIWYEYIQEIQSILKNYNLTLAKIHIHIGSGNNPKIWYQSTEKVLDLVLKHFPSVSTINLGGGFRVSRLKEEEEVDLELLGEKIIPLFQETSQKLGHKLKLEIEPGTALVALAAILLCRVEDIVEVGSNPKAKFVKLNTGMDILSRPIIYGSRHPIQSLKHSSSLSDYFVVGHCCENGDSFSLREDGSLLAYQLPSSLSIGDILEIGGVGAYASSMSLKGYNSFPTAEEYWLNRRGNLEQIKKSEGIEDFISLEM